MNQIELTILMPCLNEAESLEICIKKAQLFLAEYHMDEQGEVLIADNGSTDGSQDIARKCGCRVIDVDEKGYGSALNAGCQAAYGKYVIMGDSDDSYDFTNLMPFLEKLREGYDLVMGNRFEGGIEKGAMPASHRYLGNPVLSFVGRLFYRSKIKDFHCGLRGYNRESILALKLKTTGMEYASEMVVMAELNHLKITEVPTTLKKDARSHAPHLRSFSDGWRHLKFLFMYSPNWLFLYPGIILVIVGLLGSILLIAGQQNVGGVVFSINTLLYMCFFIIIGVNIIFLSMFTKKYAATTHFIPDNKSWKALEQLTVDKGVLIGAIMVVVGIVLTILALSVWSSAGFGPLVPESMMRLIIPSATLIEVGLQFIFCSFFLGILDIKHK